LQNWHLYRFSFSFDGSLPPFEALRLAVGDTGAEGGAAPATADMMFALAAEIVPGSRLRPCTPATTEALMLDG